MNSDEGQGARREFLLAAGRYAVALLLTGGVGAMALRDGGQCANQGLCAGCETLERCDLPQASSARRMASGER